MKIPVNKVQSLMARKRNMNRKRIILFFLLNIFNSLLLFIIPGKELSELLTADFATPAIYSHW
ncbi:MAG: hypothetical protein A2149_09195 [Candidatus Schekmanbacteria bacterium RBG_16_38_11]|uniref:Uncharacterized protein n=1 Tax=Candidatus Schekmanbacteria bacterium RBG_16_38_11 TaxID=1817880 RepID=A0A1F7RXB0_9BACT|nr:MAG: hypothetical protein A2149_09195 [Candidatus Schekmanbacteria bacterium RBG_16_38_11]